MKMVVIGLDGASFELIDPLIKEGKLPNIKKIKKNGISADLESCLPPVTCPNWKCYSTGKNPGKLGLFWWTNIDWKNKRIYYPIEYVNKNKEIWDYLSENGKKVGIINMPTTYPPKKVNGFMISGAPDAMESNFTYPKSLKKELKKKFKYKIFPNYSLKNKDNKSIKEIYELINLRFNVAKELILKYNLDFLHITIFFINSLHHFYWNSEAVKKGWQIIDKHMGFFIKNNYTIFIISDHGSNRIDYVFNINTWLEKKGYLKTKFNIFNILNYIGLNRNRLIKYAEFLHIKKIIKKYISRKIVDSIPDDKGIVSGRNITSKIDWHKSLAIASGQGPIYINPILNKDKQTKIKNELLKKLENLINPHTQKKIIRKIYTKNQIYDGKFLSMAPDLIIDQMANIHIDASLGNKSYIQLPKQWNGENKRLGIFLAYGPKIKNKQRIDTVKIIDIAPTILNLFKIKILEDMDGKIIKKILT